MSIGLIIAVALIIAASLSASLIPVIIGAVKKRRVIKPVEYFPPRGASPLDIFIQYYGAKADMREIFNPLMLYWAERGFIEIEEDCKRGLKLTKIKDLTRPESDDCFDDGTFALEQQLFSYIFCGSNKVFYTLSALSGVKTFYEKLATAGKAQAKSVTAEKSKVVKIASLLTTFAALVAVIVTVGVAIQNNLMVICIFPFVAIAFPTLIFHLPDGNGGLVQGTAVRYMCIPFFLMFGGVPLTLLIYSLPLEVAILFLCAFAVSVVNIFILNGKIDIRSDRQLKYYARICGFKKFLLLAEVEQIEKLVEEDPRYYFNVLPYCYVLKITGKLKPKFDRIALDGPACYLGELRETLMF